MGASSGAPSAGERGIALMIEARRYGAAAERAVRMLVEIGASDEEVLRYLEHVAARRLLIEVAEELGVLAGVARAIHGGDLRGAEACIGRARSAASEAHERTVAMFHARIAEASAAHAAALQARLAVVRMHVGHPRRFDAAVRALDHMLCDCARPALH